MSGRWEVPNRAEELRARAAEHLARLGITDVDPAPASPEGIYEREACGGCRRVVPVFELVDARWTDAVPGDYACGACRGRLNRAGVIGSAEWAKALGAPTETVDKLRAVDARIRRGEG